MVSEPNRKASEQVSFRVTPDEKKAIGKYATANKMSVPKMAKYLALQQAKKNTVLTNFTEEQYVTLRQDIKRIGINLNQLTKKINARERAEKKAKEKSMSFILFGDSDKELLQALRKEVENLWVHL